MGGAMGSGAGLGGQGTKATATREEFSPQEDFLHPDRNLIDRKKFQQAATEKEDDLYKTFLDMIDRIKTREDDQKSYDAWRKDKQAEMTEFAKSWRKVEEGDTFMIKDNLYLVTKEPLDSIPLNGVNILKGEQLTPQDLLNPDGTIKQPKAD